MDEINLKKPYPSNEMLESDKEYFLKKMGWNEKNLNDYIQRPEKKHDSYKSEKKLYFSMLRLYKLLKF